MRRRDDDCFQWKWNEMYCWNCGITPRGRMVDCPSLVRPSLASLEIPRGEKIFFLADAEGKACSHFSSRDRQRSTMLLQRSMRATVALWIVVCCSASLFPRLGLTVRATPSDPTTTTDSSCPATDVLQRFLNQEETGKFHVQGWRWHTLSMVREASRLERLARRSSIDDAAHVQQAAEYVVGFNMKGLHNIERDLFFPWVRKRVEALVEERSVAKAFGLMMDALEADRVAIERLGKSVVDLSTIASDASRAEDARTRALLQVADQSAEIVRVGRSMMDREDTLLVPTIGRLVSKSEQKSFNNKVIRMLGVFDSRMHLVGMHEAVWELKDQRERDLFEEAIPYLPRMMIPRWKRLLYEPKVGALDTV